MRSQLASEIDDQRGESSVRALRAIGFRGPRSAESMLYTNHTPFLPAVSSLSIKQVKMVQKPNFGGDLNVDTYKVL